MFDAPPPEAATEARATCPYCGTGCGVVLESRGGRITGVRGDPEHPANFGRLCPKGRTLHLTATPEVLAGARQLTPQWRPRKGAPLADTDWDSALDRAATQFAAALERGGPRRVAFYLSGQLLTEDYYVFNKLARALVGTNNIDSNSRLCMSSAVVGYKRTLGADAPPCSYADLELASCVLVAGANPAAAHPVLFGRLLEARRQRGTQLIVVDPRLTETARCADLHLALAPGTDLYLFTAMLGVMLRDGLVDRAFIDAHTRGFEAAAAQARALPLAEAARITRLAATDIERAARAFARSAATLSLYCQGLNQSTHGTDNNCALIHLHLATAQIGRPGAGPFSLTGQPNAMGGRETGSMATLLPGHRDPASAQDRAELAALWDVDALPAERGLTAVELFDACARGEIDALWIACTNPAQSMADQARVRDALARVPFVVVQEAFAGTETAAYADLLLPAATFGERVGTMTNSERRIALSQAAVAPPGQARADWSIGADFALRLAARIAPHKSPLFAWPDAAAVFDEYVRLTAGRDLDIAGLSHRTLARHGPQTWPLRAGEFRAGRGADPGSDRAAAHEHATGHRLYADHRFATPDGRACFVPIELRTVHEAVSDAFPLALTTVRLRDVWHGGSRSGVVAALDLPPPAVLLAPATLAALGLADDQLVELATPRGSLLLPALSSEQVPAGVAAVPMHHGSRWLPSSAGINLLTADAFDPLSMQPELKHSPARVSAASLRWHAVLMLRVPSPQAAAALDALRGLAARCRFGAVGLFGREGAAPAALLQLADDDIRSEALDALSAALGLAAEAPRLVDPRAGRLRIVQLQEGRVTAARLEGRSRADVAAWSTYRRLIGDSTDCSQRSLRELFAPA